jgi:predicted phage baseplate assembly protein
VSLPQIQLDDRDFQSLVDEARTRIAHTCPAWDEHNVSDPGITLIELFAWMTELLIYRVNRIPEKVQIALLDLMGMELAPAKVAKADLRFRLSAPARTRVQIPAGAAEVATAKESQGEPVVFRTSQPISVPPLQLQDMKLVREGTASELPVKDGVAWQQAAAHPGLWSPSEPEDGIYLGFLDPLASLLISVDVQATPAYGTGIAPSAPPWIWEVSDGDGAWSPVTVLEGSDSTGGFNYATGTIELQLPPAEAPASVAGRHLHWLRCRLPERQAPGASGYTRAPIIKRVQVAAIGVLVQAEHAARVSTAKTFAEAESVDGGSGEILGYSDGSPGQVFRVRHLPALDLAPDEGLAVIDPSSKEWVAWTLRDSLADSGPDDPHYCFDPISGEVCLGLAIRERDGWVQRGRIPDEGAAVRLRYRWGGGAAGNVDVNTLTVLRRTLPGIASVTNPERASGGVDQQSLAELLRCAPLELRTRSRAVTAEDHEILACKASRRVARAHCMSADRGETLVCILPRATDPAGRVLHAELDPPESLLKEVAAQLDELRLLGSSLRVVPLALRGVSVVAEVLPEAHADPEQVERDVAKALYRYVNPYVGGSLTGEGKGWELGRSLSVEEVRLAIREAPGVREVLLVRLYRTDLATGMPEPRPVEEKIEIGPHELVASAEHLVAARRFKTP